MSTRFALPARSTGRLAIAFLGAVLLTLSFTSTATASTTLLQISTDPYTNTTSQHKTEVEPDTFSFGSTIVSAFQVGRFFSGGASNIGFATSTNGGNSWTAGFLPGTTPFSTPASTVWARTSDPSVAYDAKHGVWLISFLGLFPNGAGSTVDVLVSRSADGGLTWSNPVAINTDGHFNDKNWTVCDNTASSPFYGNCYTEYDDNTLGDLIQMSTSSDGGLTWGPGLPTANNAHGIGGQPLVQPNGRVIVPINGFAGVNFLIVSFTSDNGGASWGKTNIVARVAFRRPAGGLRATIPLPSAEVDAAGKVYVVWSDCHFEPTCPASDIVLSTSTDHFIAGLAVDRTTSGNSAHLVVTFYYYPNSNCTTSTCELNVGYATSKDGGATWTANTHLAGPMSLTWLPNTSQGFMVGDYISTSFSRAPAYPAFALANPPSGGLFDEATYTVRGGLSVAGAIAARDQVSAGSADTLTSSTVTAQ